MKPAISFLAAWLLALAGTLAAAGLPDRLPRSMPAFEGVESAGIVQFLETLEARGFELHSFMLLRHGKVVAETWWQAKTALDKVAITYDHGPHAKESSASFAEVMKAGLHAPEAFVGNRVGDAPAALAGAARKIEAVYGYPHQNHATMEPMNAVAIWTPERCELWTPTQNGEAALAAPAAAAGLRPQQCDVHKMTLGGGFGRRGAVHDWVHQTVAIAKAMPGTPVKLVWSREEDMLHGRYHPVTQCKLTAGLDDKGNLTT
jgi:isoquinoline 1-oxidoreductase beta subunit